MNWSVIQWRSLKTRTTLFMLSVFLISLWSLFFYASKTLREEMTRQLGKQQLSTVSIVATAINNELNSRFRALHGAAKEAAPLMSDTAALQESLDHQPALRLLFNGGVIATGPDGRAIADLPRSTGRVGTNYANDPWISSALKEGKSTVGRPIIGKVLHVPVFPMTVPIRDSRGKVVGTLNGVVNLGKPNFLDAITHSNYGNTGGFLLIAPQYRLIVTASDKHRIMERLPAPGLNPTIDRALKRKGGTYIFVDPHGAEVLASGKVVPASGWHVVVSLPTKEAFAPIYEFQHRILLATLLLTLLAGCLTWLMLKRQLSPLTDAAETLAKLSHTEGPLDVLPVTSQDEVGELIRSFNRLLLTLKKHEESLEESHETLRSILATTKDGYWRVDRHGHLRDVNPTYCQQSGYIREELLGMQVDDLEAVEDAKDTKNRIRRIIKKGNGQFEAKHRRKDGTIWHVEVSTSYRDGNGEFFSFIRDITERKRLEQARLTSQKLEALGTLAGGIAHDFNNILMAIMGNAEFATLKRSSKDIEPELEEIIKAGGRAKELVRRIMAFGRPAEPAQEVVDLGTVFEEVLQLLRPVLPANILLEKDFAEGTPRVLADAGQVHEAIVNLTTNAAYAIGERTGSIQYRLEPVQAGAQLTESIPGLKKGSYACLTVTDSGCGMDEETLKRIFDVFYTTKPVGEGTGLGLSVVHGIIKSHGGVVTVESTPGKGSSFALYFPAAREQAAEQKHDPPEQRPSASGQRILYVDDEESLVSLADRVLPLRGHRVSSFTDPREALEAFLAHPSDFDVVVTDLSMPHMSGFDLARAILAVRPEMPLLMTTGHLQAGDEDLAHKTGIRGLVLKPIRMDELARVLDQMLGRVQKDGISGKC